jgi:hypothetical protein
MHAVNLLHHKNIGKVRNYEQQYLIISAILLEFQDIQVNTFPFGKILEINLNFYK